MKNILKKLATMAFAFAPLCLPMDFGTHLQDSDFLLFDGQVIPITSNQELESDLADDNQQQENLPDNSPLNIPPSEETTEEKSPEVEIEETTDENYTETELPLEFKCHWNGGCESFMCQQDLCDHVSEKHAVKNERFKNHCKCLWTLENGKICGRILSRLDTFRSHLQLHTKNTPISCTYCPKKFTTEIALKTHKKNAHNKDQKIYTCRYCNETFANQHFYRKHIAEEENNEPYCLECQKTFATTSTLNTHIRTVHEKVRAYSCDVCERTFLQSGHLKAHQRKCCGI